MVASLDRDIHVYSESEETSGTVLISGLRSSFQTVRSASDPRGIRICIDVLATRGLFGVPAGELANTVIELSELTPSIREVEEHLECPKIEDVFKAIDDFFTGQEDQHRTKRRPRQELVWVWNQILASDGTLRVSDLASELGWSRRHLTEQFRKEFGITTKHALRVVQFEHACARLKYMPTIDLAQLACDAGFSDQAHLSRAWTEFTGWSPTKWLQHEFPFIQDNEVAALR